MSLYRPEVHVPLIMFGPSGIPKGQVVDAPVSLRDLCATIVDRLGFSGESPFPGHSLAPLWNGSNPISASFDDPIVSEVNVRTKISRNPDRPPSMRGPLSSILAEGRVYLRDAVGREEIYDLSDREEANNLALPEVNRALLERYRNAFDRINTDRNPGS